MALTIQQLVADIQRELDDSVAAEDRARSEIKSVLKSAEGEGRRGLTAEEDEFCEVRMSRIEREQDAQKTIRAKLARAKAAETEERQAETRLDSITETPAGRKMRGALPKYDQVMRIGNEAHQYNRGSDPRGTQFISDLVADFTGNGRGGASERLNRHYEEQRVDYPQLQQRGTGTLVAAFSGLVVPQYLVDMVAPSVANLRPLANIANRHVLPEHGMKLEISRVTTASSAALQTTELTDVSWTDMDDTILEVPVLTAAGQQLVSRQLYDRGQAEDTIVEDLLRQVATQVDYQMLNQATTGALACGQAVTYTQASPTADTHWPVLFQMESKLEKTLQGVATPDVVLMRSDRWNWLTSQVSTSHPWVASNGNTIQGGIQLSSDYGTVRNTPVRGRLANGQPVVVDNNIPNNVGAGSNEDRILVVASREAHIWEDANSPVLIRAEQPNAGKLGVNLVAFEYFAYSFQRYANNPVYCSGTGNVVTTALANF